MKQPGSVQIKHFLRLAYLALYLAINASFNVSIFMSRKEVVKSYNHVNIAAKRTW